LLTRAIPNSKNQTTWFRFSDGVEAVLPCLAITKKFGIKKLESLPWGTYGSIICNDFQKDQRLNTAIQKMLSIKTPIAEIITHPPDTSQYSSAKLVQKRVTHILPLNPAFEENWQKFQSRARTSIRKARQNGVLVWKSEPATYHRAVSILKNLYRKACGFWEGVETLPDLFFDSLNLMKSNNQANNNNAIFVAEIENRPIAADLLLYGKGEVQYFAGASDRDYSTLQAPKLVMSEMIRDACEQGYSNFNFGSSGNLKGVEQFKRLFSAEEKPYHQIRFVHPLLKYF